MAETKKPDIEVFWQRVSIVERFSLPLYPINVSYLLSSLPSIGFIVPDLVLRGTPEQGKPIATRGDAEILINTDNKTLGVKDSEPVAAASVFLELREFYKTLLAPSPLEVHYVEFDGIGFARSKENPLKVISRLWRENKTLAKISSIIGQEATNYGLEIVPRDQDPNNPKWFHIVVHPSITSGSKEYTIRWIWRDVDSDHLIKRFSKVTDTLRSVIAGIQD